MQLKTDPDFFVSCSIAEISQAEVQHRPIGL